MVDYKLLSLQIKELGETHSNYVPLFSNASAMLFEALPDINWAGFYMVEGDELVLGPFQGKVACVILKKGKGVCTASWEQDSTLVVPDVHKFPGHIACDSASNSEIVVPIHRDGMVVAVLDIDSPSFDRFGDDDKIGLEEFVRTIEGIVTY